MRGTHRHATWNEIECKPFDRFRKLCLHISYNSALHWFLEFHTLESGFQVLDFGFQSLVDSGFLEMYSGFQSVGFRISHVNGRQCGTERREISILYPDLIQSHTEKWSLPFIDPERSGYEIREALGTSLNATEHDFYQVFLRKRTQASWRDQTLHEQLILL